MGSKALLLAFLGLSAGRVAAQNAETLYGEACDAGDATSCGLLALMYELGQGVTQDLDKAVGFHERACDGGVGDACNHLGVLYLGGEAAAQRPELAFAAFDRACGAKHLAGCVNLGMLYRDGRGVEADFSRAQSLFQETCLEGHEDGCAQLELTRRPPTTRFAQAPSLQNVEEAQRALVRNYPPELRAAGIGSTVRVWMFVDREGRVAQALLATSSRIRALDEAALAVADVLHFSAAIGVDGEPVAVWVSFPITFQVR